MPLEEDPVNVICLSVPLPRVHHHHQLLQLAEGSALRCSSPSTVTDLPGGPAGVSQTTILTKPVSRENFQTMNAAFSPSAGLLVGDNESGDGERSALEIIDTHAHKRKVHNKGWNFKTDGPMV